MRRYGWPMDAPENTAPTAIRLRSWLALESTHGGVPQGARFEERKVGKKSFPNRIFFLRFDKGRHWLKTDKDNIHNKWPAVPGVRARYIRANKFAHNSYPPAAAIARGSPIHSI